MLARILALIAIISTSIYTIMFIIQLIKYKKSLEEKET
jgi:tellurite resistance protein TehA-like permease